MMISNIYLADLEYVKNLRSFKELKEAEVLYKTELGLLIKSGLFSQTDKLQNRKDLEGVQEVLYLIKLKLRSK